MSILDDIGAKLEADNVVKGATGWGLGKGYMPSSPDQVITIYETGGPEPDQTDGTPHTFPTIQIRGRGVEFGYSELRTKMQEVYDSLNNSVIAGYVYVYPVESGPTPIGFDKENNRPELTWNFRTMAE